VIDEEVTYECYVTVRVEVYDQDGALADEQITEYARNLAVQDISHLRADELHVEYDALL